MADTPKTHAANPSKSLLLTHFVYKACLVTIFLVLVPLFPSLAPDFINQTLHARSWEVLQLIFVGIAVSYGLFSTKNDEPLKEKEHSPNNAQSYVSKLLQVSSVFDDESETVIEENNDNNNNNSKFQLVNSSQYYRGQPPVVVVPKQENGVVSEITQKPLLLPVRSLKQRLPTLDDYGKTVVEGENVVVLPSPIPWRSRSEVKADESRSFRSKNLSPSPSIRKLSPATSVSPVRKKGVAAPPPPPPPPPQIRRKSTLMKSNSSVAEPREKEVLRRIVSSVAESEIPRRSNSDSMRTFRSSGLVRGESTDVYEMKKFAAREEEIDKVLVESTDDDDDSEDDFMEGRRSSDDGGPDVDKKADEFIAKFREQIRQQRIESIRKSAAQRSTGNKINST